jgi:hypothetical protein
MRIVGATFTLVERRHETLGGLDVIVRLPGGEVRVTGIVVDLIAAARNDERAFAYPAGVGATLDADTIAAITTALVPHVRLLTRRRVIPLEHVFAF